MLLAGALLILFLPILIACYPQQQYNPLGHNRDCEKN